MMAPGTWSLLFTLSASFAGGVLLGIAYFCAVRATADLIVTGGRPSLAIVLTLARIGLLGAGFVLALQAGGFAVLAALAGVLVGRGLTMRRLRGVSA